MPIGTLPTITTGNTDMDAAIVILLALFAGVAAIVGLGSGTQGSLVVWKKIKSYVSRAL